MPQASEMRLPQPAQGETGRERRVRNAGADEIVMDFAAPSAIDRRSRVYGARHRWTRDPPAVDEIVIALNTGVVVRIPRQLIPGLENASPKDLARVRRSMLTTSLRFDTLDADYAVRGLLRKAMGRTVMRRQRSFLGCDHDANVRLGFEDLSEGIAFTIGIRRRCTGTADILGTLRSV